MVGFVDSMEFVATLFLLELFLASISVLDVMRLYSV